VGRKRKVADPTSIEAPTKVAEVAFEAGENGEVVQLPNFKYHPDLDDPLTQQEIIEKSHTTVNPPYPTKPDPETNRNFIRQKHEEVPNGPKAFKYKSDEDIIKGRNYTWYTLKDSMAGSSFHVAGSGPSLKNVMKELPIKRTICVNSVPLLGINYRYWYCCDKPIEGKHDYMIKWALTSDSNEVIKVVTEAWDFVDDYHENPFFRCKTFLQGPISDPEKGGLFHGKSSVIGAVDLARMMGAKVIFLHGVDYTSREHAYDKDHPELIEQVEWNMERVERSWTNAMDMWSQLGIQVFNANPNSALNAVPRCSCMEALRA
jgi:hypothetical protein